jgi:flavin reductase (DIM6/NTAB) family NADH-FMN oxidoreductase RutF
VAEAELVADMPAAPQYQFGNSLAVTVYVQDSMATWVAIANCGVFVIQLVQAAVAAVTLLLL